MHYSYEQDILRWTSQNSPFELSTSERDGYPVRMFVHGPRSVAEIVKRSRLFGERVFVVSEGARVSYRQFGTYCDRLAQLLRRHLMVGPGMRVGILVQDGLVWLVTLAAVSIAGGTAVLLDDSESDTKATAAVHRANCNLVLTDDAGRWKVDLHGIGCAVIRMGPRSADGLGGPEVDVLRAPGASPLASTTTDEALVLFTSGTTGESKPVLMTQTNVTTGLMNMLLAAVISKAANSSRVPTSRLGPEGACVMPLAPLSHVGGCAQALLMWYLGGRLVLCPPGGSEDALDWIEREGVRSLAGVTHELLLKMLRSQDAAQRLRSVRSVHLNGVRSPASVRRALAEVIPGAALATGYGLSETFGTICATSSAQGAEDTGVVGRILPSVEVRTLSTDSAPAVEAERGEILIRGAMVARGYCDGLELREIGRDGWLRTGDFGRTTSDGHLYLEGRCTLILRGDRRWSWAELERVACASAGVEELIVVGLPTDTAPSHIVAVLESAKVQDIDEEIRHALREAGVSRNIRIDVIGCLNLPRTPGGKVSRHKTRQLICTLS